jgi:hypothetical protein
MLDIPVNTKLPTNRLHCESYSNVPQKLTDSDDASDSGILFCPRVYRLKWRCVLTRSKTL